MLEYNEKRLFKVLEALYRITNARISVHDEWYNEILAYPQKYFKLCEKMRKNVVVDNKCKRCDQKAFKIVNSTREPYTYQCDMGLFESVAPIAVDDKIVGYIMIGQILTTSGKNVVKENIQREFESFDELFEILNSMQAISADKLTASAYLMSICAEYLCAYKGISNKAIGRAKKIENYINENMSEKITVETLEKEFHVSRTTLHNLFKESFSHSVNEHIIYLRVEKAKELLRRGDEVSQVRKMVGIADRNYFSRIFKSKTGLTVNEYLFSCGQFQNNNGTD